MMKRLRNAWKAFWELTPEESAAMDRHLRGDSGWQKPVAPPKDEDRPLERAPRGIGDVALSPADQLSRTQQKELARQARIAEEQRRMRNAAPRGCRYFSMMETCMLCGHPEYCPYHEGVRA